MAYAANTLPQLRQELKRRNAKVSGRKRELIERLEFYDRNNNVGQIDVIEDYCMSTPPLQQYKDINTNTMLPKVSYGNYTTYLSQFDKHHEQKIENMYKEKFLICIRHASGSDLFYVRGRVAAEMKKSVVYNADVAFDKHGVILECQCDCGAGMGPGAHCKHICIVLYALCKFSESNTIAVQETCTETLQQFHRAKKFKGSPVKASDLVLRNYNTTSSRCMTNHTSFDPRPVKYQNRKEYNTTFRNMCLNYSLTLPICQMFEPANLYAVANDHDYLKFSPEEMFLQNMNISTITENTIGEIEAATRGQYKNPQWICERLCRITSSNFGRICKATSKTDMNKLARQMVQNLDIKSKSIVHGRLYEKVAVQRYTEISGNQVADCGLIVCKDHPFLASSPDGIVSDNVILEVKCPYSAKDCLVTPESVTYLNNNDGGLYLDENHNYYYQVQGQMLCSGRDECDFVIYTLEDIKIVRIVKNDKFIADMTQKLEAFYRDHFRKVVLDRFFYHDYRKYNFSR